MDVSQMKNQDPYWSSLLFLFCNHSKLKSYLTDEYINLDEGFINQEKLLKKSKPWSRSEQFILKLAMHLYAGIVKIDLNEIDCLDDNNKKLVFKALQIRFQ